MKKPSKKKVILVTGGKGVVGSYIVDIFGNSQYQCVLTTKEDGDVTSLLMLEQIFQKHKPYAVIHLAAKTDVDACEKDPDDAYRVNTKGTKNIVDISNKYGSTIIIVSTSAVFDGKRKGFSETDKPNPVNVYGKSKHQAEQYTLANGKKYYIIRAGWMIGGGKKEKKFVSYILNQIKQGKEIKAVNDKFGTLTYARELVEFIKGVVEEKKPYGIYHWGSSGICSRFDMAKKIVAVTRKKVKVHPVSSKAFSQAFSAPRPEHEVLISSKHNYSYSWEDSLENYLRHEII